MSNRLSIYLVLLGAALLGAVLFAYTGLKRLRAQGDRVPTGKRLVVYLASAGSALVILATSFVLMEILQDETGNWQQLPRHLSTAVACTLVAGTVARLYSSPSSS